MNEMHVDSSLKTVIGKFDILKNQLALSDTLKEKAIHLYKKIIEKNITKGRPIDAMIAATIYAACRDSETSCTLNDVTEATGIRKNSIAKCYRAILTNLNLQMPVSDIESCVLRIAKDMGISERVKQYAIRILDNAKKILLEHISRVYSRTNPKINLMRVYLKMKPMSIDTMFSDNLKKWK